MGYASVGYWTTCRYANSQIANSKIGVGRAMPLWGWVPI